MRRVRTSVGDDRKQITFFVNIHRKIKARPISKGPILLFGSIIRHGFFCREIAVFIRINNSPPHITFPKDDTVKDRARVSGMRCRFQLFKPHKQVASLLLFVLRRCGVKLIPCCNLPLQFQFRLALQHAKFLGSFSLQSAHQFRWKELISRLNPQVNGILFLAPFGTQPQSSPC